MKMPPPYDSRQIANCLIKLAKERGEIMSITRLLKLAYMAHGWTLAIIEKPLVNDYVQAWRYGPVIPSIYYAFRPYGIDKLNPIQLVEESAIESDVNKLLVSVYELYRNLNASQLSALTHIKGGPWHATYVPNKRNIIIPNNLISDHFKDKLERSKHGTAK